MDFDLSVLRGASIPVVPPPPPLPVVVVLPALAAHDDDVRVTVAVRDNYDVH